MDALFRIERTKQRMLIKLDETRILMGKSARRMLERGTQLDEAEKTSDALVENSRRMYWASVPWYKRWLYCCFT